MGKVGVSVEEPVLKVKLVHLERTRPLGDFFGWSHCFVFLYCFDIDSWATQHTYKESVQIVPEVLLVPTWDNLDSRNILWTQRTLSVMN